MIRQANENCNKFPITSGRGSTGILLTIALASIGIAIHGVGLYLFSRPYDQVVMAPEEVPAGIGAPVGS